MKSEDFERLKAVCEKEGFILSQGGVIPSNSILCEIYKKDIWEGVEFVDRNTTNFPICRFSRSYGNTVWYYNSEGQEVCWPKDQIKPSTESAYIEQLKAESFKRFGEIKDGDRFMIEGRVSLTSYNGFGFKYFKDQDLLFFNGYHLYHQGKWATRVPERVKVELVNVPTVDSVSSIINFDFKLSRNDIKLDYWKFLKDVTNYIEEYLNK